MTPRDPRPAASFNEPPTFLSGAYWAMRDGGAGRASTADLFARLRARRAVIVRLVAAAVGAACGLGLLALVPVVGLAVLLIAVWSAAVDALLLARLRRSIAEAWVDLAHPPDGSVG